MKIVMLKLYYQVMEVLVVSDVLVILLAPGCIWQEQNVRVSITKTCPCNRDFEL